MAHTLPRDPRSVALLSLAALGVVYGDIGTSPLYAWNEIARTGVLTGPDQVLGATSLVWWTLTLAITVKYVMLVLRADNHGEGGTFALMGLLREVPFVGRGALLAGLTFAACLLYADGLLTPAISVVSAMEGLAVANEALHPMIVPAALAVLAGLFSVQRFGTARLGTIFGVVCVVWFLVIGGLGLTAIARHPGILAALLPHHAARFLAENMGWRLGAVLGAVVLAITGGEALYADIGHFGVATVRRTWYAVVYPALSLSYLGQGAVLYAGVPLRGENVFYTLVPERFTAPMIVLATAAAIIASQALVSGAFSLTRSAIHLGLVPRMGIRHTSEHVEGQIYVPLVNAFLWLGCSALVLGFRSSAGLAHAYGLAVMGVVLSTTVACAVLAFKVWAWTPRKTALVFVPFLLFDLAYFAANVEKIPHGAWVPLVFAAALYAAMWGWQDGRSRLFRAIESVEPVPLDELLGRPPLLLPRAFVFLVPTPVRSALDPAPILLRKFVDRYGALPAHVTLFTVVEEASVPWWRGPRFDVARISAEVVAVAMHVGFMETPDVRAALVYLKTHRHIQAHAHRWTLVTGQEELVFEAGAPLRLQLFGVAMQFAGQAHRFFGLGADTNVSREVLPVRVTRDGQLEVAVRTYSGGAPAFLEAPAAAPAT